MLFLKFSNADVSFGEKVFIWKTYTTNKALFTTKQVEIINKKDFIIAALDVNSETFVMHVHSKRQVQIEA